MKHWKQFAAAAWAAASLVLAREARAENVDCRDVTSGTRLTRLSRDYVMRCAVASSMAVRAEEKGARAADGRRTAAGVALPSNPTLGLTLGMPTDPVANEANTLYSATLSQELEIAGQRGARIDAAEAEQKMARSRVLVARRDVVAAALANYFDALAAAEGQRIARRLTDLAQALKGYATARAQIGLSAPVDAVLAESEAVQLTTLALEVDQRLAETQAALAVAVGLDPVAQRPDAEGTLTPMAIPEAALRMRGVRADGAVVRTPEIDAAMAERRAEEARARALRRSRVPNPTVSIFARRDWIQERAVGIGLSFPIPLARNNAGEIEEANALAERAEAEAERLRRETRLRVVQAAEAFARRKDAVDRFDPEAVRKAEGALEAIADELATRKLALRDALVMQRSLIDLLFGYVEARRKLCLASVELARVTGTLGTLEGGAR
ncbi:TolC family protein [Pendulispora brunnea]|uniref:TolC family protein n=1 Tax=Pendulispora brunnea TaxID=2905690 RepID=A0ABZ2KMH6_9BACT